MVGTASNNMINSMHWRVTPTMLNAAAEDGLVEMMSNLLSDEDNVNQRAQNGQAPLHIAASSGTSLEVVKILVEAGADVDCRNVDGFTPLMSACLEGHYSIGSYLVRSGAEVNASNMIGMTPLHLAAFTGTSLEMVKMLVEAGADVSLYNKDNFTTLMYACSRGNDSIGSYLVRNGAELNACNDVGMTALHIATYTGTSLEMVKMLVKAGADVNRYDNDNFTSLMYACRQGHDSIGSYLVRNGAEVNARNNVGMTPLLFAIRAKSLGVPLISALLKAKACVNVCDSNGVTPLHAIIESHDVVKWDVLELLLSYPCDIDAKRKCSDFTPLLLAMHNDDRKSALMLIKAGCKVDTKYHSGRGPMSHAIKYKLYPDVELLLAAGERIPREEWMDIKSLLENEEPSMVKRLLNVGAECPKLSNMCRRAFYNHYGIQTRKRIDELPLSQLIKRYLTYEIL